MPVGFDVTVTATLRSSPSAQVLAGLADQFEAVEHEPGSATLKITEHVAVSEQADAVAFVRQLVAEGLPDGSAITDVTSTSD